MRISEAELQRLLGRGKVQVAAPGRTAKPPRCYRCHGTGGELMKTGGDKRLWAHMECHLAPIDREPKPARRVLYRGGEELTAGADENRPREDAM